MEHERFSILPIPLTRQKNSGAERHERSFIVETGFATICSKNHNSSIDEDHGFCDAARGLLLTADGMGSGPAPHLASARMAEIIEQILQTGPKAGDPVSEVVCALLTQPLTEDRVETVLSQLMLRTDAELRAQIDTDVRIFKSALLKFKEIYNVPYDSQDPQDVKDMQDMIKNAHGTTQIAAKLWQNEFGQRKISFSWVGDSRLYRVRRGKLARLTKDDSMTQVCIDAGLMREEDADRPPIVSTIRVKLLSQDMSLPRETREWLTYLANTNKHRERIPLSDYSHMVINTLGGGKHMLARPHVSTHPVETSDIYFAVSDGVTKVMNDRQLEYFFELFGSLSAADLAKELMLHARSLAENNPDLMDDITVTCVKC